MVRIPRRVLKGRSYIEIHLICFLVMRHAEVGVIKAICNSHIVS